MFVEPYPSYMTCTYSKYQQLGRLVADWLCCSCSIVDLVTPPCLNQEFSGVRSLLSLSLTGHTRAPPSTPPRSRYPCHIPPALAGAPLGGRVAKKMTGVVARLQGCHRSPGLGGKANTDSSSCNWRTMGPSADGNERSRPTFVQAVKARIVIIKHENGVRDARETIDRRRILSSQGRGS